MAEKKSVKKKTKKQIEADKKHDITITLMAGVLVVLTATAAVAVACIFYINNL